MTTRPSAVAVPQPHLTPEDQSIIAAVRAAGIDLTPEEQALIDRHTLEGLDRALADAHDAVTLARPAERTEAQHQYLLLLNLVSKLAPSPPPVPKDVVARQQEYLQAMPDEERRLAALPEPERAAKLAEFKQRFFERKTSQTGQ